MYVIVSSSQYGTEVIDTAADRLSAINMVGEYRLAFGPSWLITYRRKRASDD